MALQSEQPVQWKFGAQAGSPRQLAVPHRAFAAASNVGGRASWTLYTGGRTQIDGKDNADYQGNTRLGATWAMNLHPRHAIKVVYFRNVIARVGSDMRSIGISYNFIWLRGR